MNVARAPQGQLPEGCCVLRAFRRIPVTRLASLKELMPSRRFGLPTAISPYSSICGRALIGSCSGCRERSKVVRQGLLFLSQTLPIPDRGAGVRSYNIIRQLARSYDVTILSFYRKDAHPDITSVAGALTETRRFADVEVFPIPHEFNRPRLAFDHMRSVLKRRAYTAYVYASNNYADRLRVHLSSGRYAMVHLDSLDLVAYLPMMRGLRIACTHHNVESALLRRRAGMEANAFRHRYMRYQAELLEAEERRWCPRMAVNLVMSDTDAATLLRIAPAAGVRVVPNGVDTEFFKPTGEIGNGVVFVGPASWRPNVDAMRFLGREILPRIRNSGDPVQATWVGRAPQAMRAGFARDFGVTATGFVTDVRPAIASAACYVVPLRTGGGTRLKILEAWSMGKAVVSTSVGCQGLAAEDGVNILVRDSAEGFAVAVRSVLTDVDLRERLGRAARQTAVRLYDWELIGKRITQEYAALHDVPARVTVA